jgi:tRNA/rRNA methyltransferase
VIENLRIVLVSPRNPLNIGAAARAMSNFGFFHLRLVNAYDVAFREARSAVGASQVLVDAQEFPTVAHAVADCPLVVGTTSLGHRQLQHSLRRLEYAGAQIRPALAAGPVALLFGSEKYGLSNEDMSLCHWLLRIPTRDAHGSMNLGQAVSICLYELIRETDAGTHQPMPIQPATSGELSRFEDLLIESLSLSGYLQERTSESTKTKIRRLIRRLNIPSRDAELWQGMLRQILWKLKQE